MTIHEMPFPMFLTMWLAGIAAVAYVTAFLATHENVIAWLFTILAAIFVIWLLGVVALGVCQWVSFFIGPICLATLFAAWPGYLALILLVATLGVSVKYWRLPRVAEPSAA